MDPHPDRSQARGSTVLPSKNKPVVIGLYGVPGSGKSYLLKKLQQNLLAVTYKFKFFEGSSIIASLTPGGLSTFGGLSEEQKLQLRKNAIDEIAHQCRESGVSGVVAGHFMFWNEGESVGTVVMTPNDLETYTHILYLKVDGSLVKQRCLRDKERERGPISASHLDVWQKLEENKLRDLCYKHGIIFSTISQRFESEEVFVERISILFRDFMNHSEELNQRVAERRLEEIIVSDGQGRTKTMLVMDADRTLAPQDAGTMFWTKARTKDPLKTLFGTMGYSYNAFRQATLLYEEAADARKFDAVCEEVALEVTMYPEFLVMLQQAAKQDHVGAVVVTCGLRRIWEKVLEREGLSDTVKVIGGGRIADGHIVHAGTKAALVNFLRSQYRMDVWAFGDSPLDLPMLIQANRSIIVVGEEKSRSKTMDAALANAIQKDGLAAYQIVIPSTAPPRLNTVDLPLIYLSQTELDHIFSHASIHVVHATNQSAVNLLTTPTRDAAVAGPVLRKAHFNIGWYLATEFIGDIIGLENVKIAHVQNRLTDGHRLAHESTTVIVPLMRGGEPMAQGVNHAFPLAMFVHAKEPEDLKLHHLKRLHTLILVDSVINSGKSIMEFLEHVRSLDTSIRIVVVANVVQSKFVSAESLSRLQKFGSVSIVALRLSDNQYTGTGGTDTGNRLFNTTHLP